MEKETAKPQECRYCTYEEGKQGRQGACACTANANKGAVYPYTEKQLSDALGNLFETAGFLDEFFGIGIRLVDLEQDACLAANEHCQEGR